MYSFHVFTIFKSYAKKIFNNLINVIFLFYTRSECSWCHVQCSCSTCWMAGFDFFNTPSYL